MASVNSFLSIFCPSNEESQAIVCAEHRLVPRDVTEHEGIPLSTRCLCYLRIGHDRVFE